MTRQSHDEPHIESQETEGQKSHQPKSGSLNAPHLEAFKQVIESRRSIRRFTDTPIPDEVLKDCLRMAMLAPNASNLQQWEFYVIDSEEVKKKAVKLCLGQNAAKTSSRLIAVVARTDNWRQHSKQIIKEYPQQPVPAKVKRYYEKLIPLVYTQDPINALAVVKWGFATVHRKVKGPVVTPYYTQADQAKWALSNTFLAAENLMLALRAYGFDSCPMGGFDEPGMKKLLGLTRHHHIAMMIGAGERSDNGIYNEQFRFDYDQFVKHV